MDLSRRDMLAAGSAPLLISAARTSAPSYGTVLATYRDVTLYDGATDAILTLGFRHAGDGGQALYRRVAVEPSHQGKVRSAAGVWFELAEPVVRPEMFGAKADGSDDRDAIQAALDTAVARRGRLELAGGRYAMAGQLTIGAAARGFAIVGVGQCRLEQLLDNCSHFYFSEEDSANWTISGIEFSWKRNQTANHPLSYAVRFDTRSDKNHGHRNFVIGNCSFVNGWRGIGVTPEPYLGLRCPVWGATLRDLRCEQQHSGALLFLAGFGKTGQPNISLQNIYIRGDAMTEAAIRLEGCDTVEMRGIEFNLTRQAGIEFRYGRSLVISGMRFEQSSAGSSRDRSMIYVEGAMSRASITGLTIQNSKGSLDNRGSVIFAHRGAVITVTDPVIVGNGERGGVVAPGLPVLAATGEGGAVVINGIGHCLDAGSTIARDGGADGVSCVTAEIIRIPIGGQETRAWATQPGVLVEMWLIARNGEGVAVRVELSPADANEPARVLRTLRGKRGGVQERARLFATDETRRILPGDEFRIFYDGHAPVSVEVILVIARA